MIDSCEPKKASYAALADGALVHDALCGLSEAFGELVRRYRSLAYATALHYLGRVDDAQDAAQEALIQTFAHLADLREPEHFQPWLYRATVNRCLAVLRGRKPTYPRDESLEGPSARDIAEEAALRIAVRDALETLPEKLRLTITLCYLHGRSHDEVARYLDLPIATVRSRLQHAKRRLRAELSAYSEGVASGAGKEMAHMVEQSIKQTKPGRAWSRKVVREVLLRADEARKAYSRAEALRLYDQALGSLQQARATTENHSLALQALFEKQSLFAGPCAQKVELLEEARELAQKTGARASEARAVFDLAGANRAVPPYTLYRDALSIYRELDDIEGQGKCLLFLGGALIMSGETEEGQTAVRQALPLLEQSGSTELFVLAQSVLEALGKAGDRPITDFVLWSALCTSFEQKQQTTRLAGQSGFTFSKSYDSVPYPTLLGNVFYHAGLLQLFLDRSVGVGGGWSRPVWSFSEQPLTGTITVLSDTETIDTPAGQFEKCLLTELTVAGDEAEDKSIESQKTLNRVFVRGTRRVWYAPNVGLVQIEVETEGGGKITSQLTEFHIAGGKNRYLPLAVGNAWTYRIRHLDRDLESAETSRVVAHDKQRWFLAQHACVPKP